MTFRGVRIPRLTLFTGPNCSLCDVNISSAEYKIPTDGYVQVAKSTLARVRQSVSYSVENNSFHSFSLLSIQRHFELDTVNIQEPGQERWKKEYVYWIPALRLDGKEIAKGRWDDQTVIQALDQWNQLQQETLPEKH
jgi:zinc finger CCHC domain-containing protein 8